MLVQQYSSLAIHPLKNKDLILELNNIDVIAILHIQNANTGAK